MLGAMRQVLIVLAGIISIISVVPYFIDVVKHKTKPRIVSWFTWTVLTVIASAAAFSDQAYASAFLTLGGSIATASIVMVGLKYGDRNFERFDIACLAGAMAGLVLWLMFGSPEIAIIATLIIDFIGALPTLKHSWQKPQEETASAFIISSFAAFVSLFAVEQIGISNLSFPLYLFLMNAAIAATIVLRKRALKTGV